MHSCPVGAAAGGEGGAPRLGTGLCTWAGPSVHLALSPFHGGLNISLYLEVYVCVFGGGGGGGGGWSGYRY